MSHRYDLCTVLLTCLLAAAVPAHGAAPPPANNEIPPLPGPAELVAKNDAERQAGAVVLESVTELSGHVAVTGHDPWTRKSRRVRYLVLDAKGAEQLRQHAFFGTTSEAASAVEVSGRTVTAQGEVFPLDLKRDVRNLDIKGPRGKVAATVRTVFFPHVEPGAVLDLAWSETSKDLPSFELVTLQEAFPVRRVQVKSNGLLLKSNLGVALLLGGPQESFFWVPFFLGPVPPRAHARVDGEFNLDLEVRDLAPLVAEPYAPPDLRTSYLLGLLPRPLGLTAKRSARDWYKNLILFGPQGVAPEGVEKEVIERDLDPAQAVVRLDDLALQPLPGWPAGDPLMASYQGLLKATETRFDRFFRHSTRAEDAAAVARIAPPDLPWKERARRLYKYARSRVKPDPKAEPAKSLDDILKTGRASGFDITLYTRFLVERAGMRARLVLALSRNLPPFQPFLPFPVFGPRLLVEVGAGGEEPLYLDAGDRFATFAGFPPGYLGGLAFREPQKEGDDWPLFQIPARLPVGDVTKVAFSSRLEPDGKPVDLKLASTLEDCASRQLRWQLGLPAGPALTAEERKGRQEVVRRWVDEWANLPYPGEPPVLDPNDKPGEPFSFTVSVPWQPDLQRAGDQLLIPALPRVDLLRNVFQEETRRGPIWLFGGHFEVSLAWELPPGAAIAALPEPVKSTGPGGLAYSLAVQSQPPALTTLLTLDVPYFLSSADYLEVRRFFEGLQRAAETRLLVRTGG